jgi:UDP-N-acetylmuramyl pentapeptide phosphotransferase/UDP-N-acetylglucosamine-1-phosphate transferase
MTEIIILAFSAFFISILGTRSVIFILKNRAVSPDVDLLMGRKKSTPLADAGIAISFALIIALLGAEISYLIILPIFFLVALAMLKNLIKIPAKIEFLVWIISVFVALFAFHLSISYKIIAGIIWLFLIHSFKKIKNTESILPTHIVIIGLGLSMISVLAEKFPSALAEQSLIFSAAGFGFLWWNLRPARVFAGYIGAVPAGFVAGYLLLLAASKGYEIPALILPAYIFAYTVGKKSFSDEWLQHLISGVDILLVMLAIFALLSPDMAWFNVTVAYILAFGLEFFIFKKSQKLTPTK